MEFIDIIIYILACIGLIFTMISIIESYNECKPYYIQSLKKDNCSEIIIKIKNNRECNNNELIERIINGEFDDLYKIVEDVKIITNQ